MYVGITNKKNEIGGLDGCQYLSNLMYYYTIIKCDNSKKLGMTRVRV